METRDAGNSMPGKGSKAYGRDFRVVGPPGDYLSIESALSDTLSFRLLADLARSSDQ